MLEMVDIYVVLSSSIFLSALVHHNAAKSENKRQGSTSEKRVTKAETDQQKSCRCSFMLVQEALAHVSMQPLFEDRHHETFVCLEELDVTSSCRRSVLCAIKDIFDTIGFCLNIEAQIPALIPLLFLLRLLAVRLILQSKSLVALDGFLFEELEGGVGFGDGDVV